MNKLRILYHLAQADFLERVRRYSFLLILGATVFLGYTIARGDFYLELEGYQGVFNSAWVGGMVSASTILLLSLFGFYFVKNAVNRDIQTGVGQIIATSPISKQLYLMGKWLSNLAVLSTMVVILAVAAVVMQWLVGEVTQMDLLQLLLPFVLLALPAMAVVAALAVFFETISWLRGGIGNVLYFFVWIFAIIVSRSAHSPWLDWSGIFLVAQSMGDALKVVNPAYGGTSNFRWGVLPEGSVHTFIWLGVQWTKEILLTRTFWIAISAGLILAGSAFFRRFDPSLEKAAMKIKLDEIDYVQPADEKPVFLPSLDAHLNKLPAASFKFDFFRTLLAELRLSIKGLHWWWYAGVAIMIIGSLVSPTEVARQWWLPAAWLWPIFIWSSLGTRERQHHTDQLVFCSPHPLLRHLPISWLSGFIVALIVGSGLGLRLLFTGDWAVLGAWLSGAIFIPSFALALGVWSGTSKLFETIYVLMWFLGPLHPQDMWWLDFMGASNVSVTNGTPIVFTIVALAFVALAALGRWRQLRT